MNHSRTTSSLSTTLFLQRAGLVALAVAALPAVAAVLYWDADGAGSNTGGSGTWDLVALRFRDGAATGTPVAWPATEADAVFSGSGGTVTIDNGAKVYANHLTFTAGNYTLAGGSLNLTGATPTITINTGVSTRFSAKILGPTATINGGGTFLFGASDLIDNGLALTIAGSSVLGLNNNSETVASVRLENGSLGLASGENGSITAGSYVVESGSIRARTHGLNATSGLTKRGSGTVTVFAASDILGATTIEAGTLAFGAGDVLSHASSLSITGGVLDLRGTNQTAKSFVLVDGLVTSTNDNGQITSGILAIDNKSAAAPIEVRNGRIDVTLQSHGLLKTGTGTVAISQTMEMDNGVIEIRQGVLDLSKATVNNTKILVSGGMLAGTGTSLRNIPVDLTSGRMAPAGDLATGSLTTGAETWRNGSGFDFNIWNAKGAAGTGWDTLSINGSLDLTKLTAKQFDLKVIGLVGATGGTGAVTNFTGNMTNPAGYSWTFVTASGGIKGFSAGLFNIDLSGFTNAYTGAFSVQKAGDSLNLVFTPVPEPTTYALLLGAATLGLVAWRHTRRRRAGR